MSWYVRDPEYGIEVYATEEEARRVAVSLLDEYRDESSEGWHENMSDLEWGRITPIEEARCYHVRPAPEGSDFDEIVDYQLVAVKD